uniref:EGF-like domain-containing protein n=1 Tax=Ditylenchus dipsaci TaxID=166011 RepID=A0A915DQG6_9BILA
MQESSIVRRKSEGAPPSAVSNPPVAFPMFRPVALSSASQIAASPTEAPTDDDHFEFVPLPSTVKARAPAEFKEIRVGENNHQFLTVFATKKPPVTTTIKDMGAVNDPCIKFECKNNGSCDVGSNFMPFCMCQNGFSGTHCEVRMCDTITCHAGLETCQIVTAELPANVLKARLEKIAEKINSLKIAQCLLQFPKLYAGQDKNVCKCAEGFLGANCNIRDLCAANSTKVSNVLINSPYLCMCYNDNSEWVDCSELPAFELPMTGAVDSPSFATPPPSFINTITTTTTIAPPVLTAASNKQNLSSDKSDELPSPVPSISWGPPTPPPLLAAASEDKSNESEKQESTKPQFPLHMHIPFLSLPLAKKASRAYHPLQKSPQLPQKKINLQQFPQTFKFLTTKTPELNIKNLTDTNDTMPNFINVNKQASNTSSVKTLENDFSTTVSDVHTPVIASTTAKPVHPALSVTGGDGDDDEQDGDNGFERVTQIADSAATSLTLGPPVLVPHYNTTTTDLSDLISTNNHSEVHETDHFGVRPPQGGFSPHEEHGGAFVSPSSEHNHVEMEVHEEKQHPSNQQYNHTYLPMPVDTNHHLPENNSIVSNVNPNKIKTSKELEFGQKGSDLDDSQENKSNSQYSNKKNSNEISESKAVDHNSVANAEQGNRSLPTGSNGNLISWIIAIGVVSFFLLSIATGTICVGRYVRRSRRLHGKYNPAREENAVACTYSMPMTTVARKND